MTPEQIERTKDYKRRYRKENRDKILQQNRDYWQKNRETILQKRKIRYWSQREHVRSQWNEYTWERKRFITEIKLSNPCVKCDEDDFRCLQFDHIDRDSKINTVSKMAIELVAWPRLVAEIEKCQILCANCHAKKTFKENEEKGKLSEGWFPNSGS